MLIVGPEDVLLLGILKGKGFYLKLVSEGGEQVAKSYKKVPGLFGISEVEVVGDELKALAKQYAEQRKLLSAAAPKGGLPIPQVSDPKLKNLVNDLYKGAKMPSPIGTGSTADAVRNELKTGLPTGGRFHSQNAQEYITALRRFLKNNPNASNSDRMVAQALLDDLIAALKGN